MGSKLPPVGVNDKTLSRKIGTTVKGLDPVTSTSQVVLSILQDRGTVCIQKNNYLFSDKELENQEGLPSRNTFPHAE